MKWTIDVMAYYLLEAGMPEHEAITAVACAWTITEGDDGYWRQDPRHPEYHYVGVYGIPTSWRPNPTQVPGSQMARDAYGLRLGTKVYPGGPAEWYGNLAAVPGYVWDAARQGVANPIAGYEPGKAPANFGINLPSVPAEGIINIPFPGLE